MKTMKILLFIPLIFLTTRSLSQDSLSHFSMPYGNGKLIIGPFTTTATFYNFNPKPLIIGIDSEYMVARNFGFGSVIAGGYNYAEISGSVLGLLGLGAWHSGDNGLWFLFILTPLVIENPCIHFKPNGSQEFVLSVSALKFRYIYRENSEYQDNIFASGSISARYNIFHKSHWQWSFYAEWVSLYHSERPKGLQIGVALRHVSYNPIN